MRKVITGVLLLAAGLVAGAGACRAAAVAYACDKVHSTVGFTVAHMMVSKISGTFDDIKGDIRFAADDLASSSLAFTVQAASINTREKGRDDHLRSDAFFDAAKFPLITFTSKKIVKDGDHYNVTGDLTLKGVTREIVVPVTVLGPVTNPMSGKPALGLEAHFRINRQDYGITWNKALDNGGLMIGNDVDVNVSIEAPAA